MDRKRKPASAEVEPQREPERIATPKIDPDKMARLITHIESEHAAWANGERPETPSWQNKVLLAR